MTYYVWVDKNHPEINLVYAINRENIDLEKVVVEVGEGEDIVQAVKVVLGMSQQT